MELLGYSAAQIAALAAVASAAAVLLYVLRLRRRPTLVPFSPLWLQVLGDRRSSQLWSQLRRWLSLLLQLVLLCSLALALGDPRWSSAAREARHVVVLVDTSLSMRATDVRPTRLERAKEELSQLIEGLGPEDQMLICGMDLAVHPRTTMTSDLAELRRGLSELSASDTVAELPRALRFAVDALQGRTNPQIILASDGAFTDEALRRAQAELGEVPLSYLPVGSPEADNLAIHRLAVRRYPLDRSRYEVLLEVGSHAAKEGKVVVELLGDGRVVEALPLELAPREREVRFYPNLSGVRRRLEARLRADPAVDQLAGDDSAYAVLPERQRSRVLVITPGNTYLEAALLLDEYLQVEVVAPGEPLPEGRFEATILDGVDVQPEPRLGGLLYLGLPEEAPHAPVSAARAIDNFGFDRVVKDSPLLRWVVAEDIQVLKGQALSPRAGDTVVGASEKGPILVSGVREGQRFVVLGFDPRQSDFVLRVGWPLFIINTLDYFSSEREAQGQTLRTGQAWSVKLPSGGGVLVGPEGSRQAGQAGADLRFVGTHAGFYGVFTPEQLAQSDTASPSASGARPGDTPEDPKLGGARQASVDWDAARVLVAANVGEPAESSIAARPQLSLGGAALPAPSGFDPRSRQAPWALLLLFVLLISSVEWLTYHRRVTV